MGWSEPGSHPERGHVAGEESCDGLVVCGGVSPRDRGPGAHKAIRSDSGLQEGGFDLAVWAGRAAPEAVGGFHFRTQEAFLNELLASSGSIPWAGWLAACWKS